MVFVISDTGLPDCAYRIFNRHSDPVFQLGAGHRAQFDYSLGQLGYQSPINRVMTCFVFGYQCLEQWPPAL